MTSPRTKTCTHRALIVGGGVAGTTCAITLATQHPSFSVTLVDPAETIKVATTILKITPTANDIIVNSQSPESWSAKNGVTFKRGLAHRLTSDSVHLKDGSTLKFDVCCLATGARPALPEGLQDRQFQQFVYSLRDTDSVERLKKKLKAVKRVMVVGAGGIAMEVVHELVHCKVFWVVKGHIGGSFFDAKLGQLIAEIENAGNDDNMGDSKKRDAVEESGTMTPAMNPHSSGAGVGPNWLGTREGPLLLGKDGEVISERRCGQLNGGGINKDVEVINAEVKKLSTDKTGGNGVEAHLSDGSSVLCDMIIVGAGVTPNTEWMQSSGVELNADDDGVITKCNSMETSLPNVYAAGDCTHMIKGGENWSQMRVWSQAYIAGRAAAAEMGHVVGGEGYAGLEFDVFAHATRFFGKKVVLLGRFDDETGAQVYQRIEDAEVLKVIVADGRVRGAVLIGDVDCAEVFENLIISGLDISFLGKRIVEREIELDEFFD